MHLFWKRTRSASALGFAKRFRFETLSRFASVHARKKSKGQNLISLPLGLGESTCFLSNMEGGSQSEPEQDNAGESFETGASAASKEGERKRKKSLDQGTTAESVETGTAACSEGGGKKRKKTKQTGEFQDSTVRSALECPVCQEAPRTGRIYQCLSGHILVSVEKKT